jgi:hypothetical protein
MKCKKKVNNAVPSFWIPRWDGDGLGKKREVVQATRVRTVNMSASPVWRPDGMDGWQVIASARAAISGGGWVGLAHARDSECDGRGQPLYYQLETHGRLEPGSQALGWRRPCEVVILSEGRLVEEYNARLGAVENQADLHRGS